MQKTKKNTSLNVIMEKKGRNGEEDELGAKAKVIESDQLVITIEREDVESIE